MDKEITVVPDRLQLGVTELLKISFSDANAMAQAMGLDLVCINEKALIYTITDEQKLEYLKKKAQKFKQKKVKTVKVRNDIGQADLARKFVDIIEFKKQGHPVRIEIGISPRYNNPVVKGKIIAFLTELSVQHKFELPLLNERLTIINI